MHLSHKFAMIFAIAAAEVSAQEPAVRLESVMTVGCEACAGPEQFGVITALSVVGGAAGKGSDESRAKRLLARFKEWKKNSSV